MVVEYPNAHLVDDALFAVTEIVECFGLEGQWVTSCASSDCTEFVATDSVREVSGCLAFIGMTAKFVISRFLCYRLPCRQSSTVWKNHIFAMRLTLTIGGESEWLAYAYWSSLNWSYIAN